MPCAQVLRCATRGMPLGEGVDLALLAQTLRGYTAADCVAVCTEAALRCAAEAVAAVEECGGELGVVASQGFLAALRVEARHVEGAVAVLGPAVLRGLCPELPEVRWEEVGGLQVSGPVAGPAYVPSTIPPRQCTRKRPTTDVT